MKSAIKCLVLEVLSGGRGCKLEPNPFIKYTLQVKKRPLIFSSLRLPTLPGAAGRLAEAGRSETRSQCLGGRFPAGEVSKIEKSCSLFCGLRWRLASRRGDAFLAVDEDTKS